MNVLVMFQETIGDLKRSIGSRTVVCLVSGGVDSAVCTAMLQKAIGKEKIIPVHIDNGFMRLNESKLVEKSLSEIGIHLEVFNESLNFSTATTRLPQKVRMHFQKKIRLLFQSGYSNLFEYAFGGINKSNVLYVCLLN